MNNKIKQLAINAATSAGNELLRRFKKYKREDSKLKSFHEIVTSADLAAEKILLQEIKSHFPSHKILSEEAGSISGPSSYLWIVDPLDGTTNFSLHNPLWAVSLGLAYRGEIVLAVVYAPFLNELYLAEKGRGAYLNGRRLKVSEFKAGRALHAFCHGTKDRDMKRAVKYYSKQKLKGFDCRQLGSASIELAFTAAGRIESIAIPGAHSWDVSAGVLLVREAGGIVSDFKGRKWNLKSQDILASNKVVHKEILSTLKGI